jgi:hypothetical protein
MNFAPRKKDFSDYSIVTISLKLSLTKDLKVMVKKPFILVNLEISKTPSKNQLRCFVEVKVWDR